jgi:hypothetical protein
MDRRALELLRLGTVHVEARLRGRRYAGGRARCPGWSGPGSTVDLAAWLAAGEAQMGGLDGPGWTGLDSTVDLAAGLPAE